jgi:hypothetical protein
MFTLAALASVATVQAVPTIDLNVDGNDLGTSTVSFGAGTVFAGASEGTSYTIDVGAITGTSAFPAMTIQSTDDSTGPIGTIIITLSDTDFGPTTGGVIASEVAQETPTPPPITSMSFNSYYSTSNLLFAEDTPLTSYSTTVLPTANVYQYGAIVAPAVYSLTEVLTISGTTPGEIQLQAGVTATPDGGTTALLVGAGLLGLGFIAQRRKFAAAA